MIGFSPVAFWAWRCGAHLSNLPESDGVADVGASPWAARPQRRMGARRRLYRLGPTVRAAARFISELRETTAGADGPVRGLLPPSKSAEDLGPTDQHYYWDNFWAVAGPEEAAYADRELGKPEDATWMEAEADALPEAILRSVEDVMGPHPAYIPGAVQEAESSAMARRTVPALWPIRVSSPQAPLVQRSFAAYHSCWIAPNDGAFRHHVGRRVDLQPAPVHPCPERSIAGRHRRGRRSHRHPRSKPPGRNGHPGNVFSRAQRSMPRYTS
jgi:hypothetical protein